LAKNGIVGSRMGYGFVDVQIWAYNSGVRNVIKGIMPKETRDYIRKYHRLTHV
jgi:hypothetical protein